MGIEHPTPLPKAANRAVPMDLVEIESRQIGIRITGVAGSGGCLYYATILTLLHPQQYRTAGVGLGANQDHAGGLELYQIAIFPTQQMINRDFQRIS